MFFIKSFVKRNKYELLLLLISILAFWQIFFLQCSLQNDMMDVTLPWRYFAGECLQQNIFPLWNPYQQLGYPFFADMQYPVWYPEEFILGFLTGYNNITLHYIFVGYIFLAGLGMYKLGMYFKMEKPVAFLVGVSFMLSGIFIGHAQSLVSVLGAVWLPWTLCCYLRMTDDPGSKINILKAIFFTFLMISGGYQAVSFILMYLLIIIFTIRVIQNILQKKYAKLKKMILANIIWTLGILILSSGIIISLKYAVPYFSRLNPISYDFATNHPFSPNSLISLLLPFSTVKNPDFFGNDISMRNLYFGIIPLLLFFYGIFRKHRGTLYIILIFGIICLLVSFGDSLPLWKILFKNIPLLNLFKYASFFRYFSLIAFLLIAGSTLSVNMNNIRTNKFFKGLIIILFIFFVIIFIWQIVKIRDFSFWNSDRDFFRNLSAFTFDEHVLIQSLIQIILLALFIFLFYFRSVNSLRLITIFVIIDLFFAVQMNMYFTGCNHYKPAEVKRDLDHKISGFPLPGNKIIAENTDGSNASGLFWRNTCIYDKSVTFDGFTSFHSRQYDHLLDETPYLLDKMLNNKILYFSTNLYPDLVLSDTIDIRNTDLFVDNTIYLKFKNKTYKSSGMDTIVITKFKPNQIVAEIYSENDQFLTLLQSDFKGWKVYIDDQEVDHFTSNFISISIQIPKGKHRVRFYYKYTPVIMGFYISLVSFFSLFLLMIYYHLKSGNIKPVVFRTILILFILCFTVKFMINRANANAYYNSYKTMVSCLYEWNEKKKDTRIIIYADNNYLFNSLMNDTIMGVFHFINEKGLRGILNESKEDFLFYIRLYKEEDPEILNLIHEKYPYVIEYNSNTDRSFYIFTNKNEINRFYDYSELNDFEKEYPNWITDYSVFDSLNSRSGIYSNYLDPANIYSHVFHSEINKMIEPGSILVSVNADVFLTTDEPVYVVCEVHRKNKIISWNGRSLSDDLTVLNEWERTYSDFVINKKLKSDDLIRIYIYKQDNQKLWIDDFEVKMMLQRKIFD